MKKCWAVSLVFLLVTACATLRDLGDGISEPPSRGEWKCPPLPETFTEAALIGTWQSRHGSWATDTIILRGDGTYQQVYHSRPNDYYYESTGNEWWLERRASGGLYLHLDNMRYCLSTDELCRKEDGGGGDWTYYDRCEGRSIPMGGQVILTVTGVEGIRFPGIDSAPRGIVLWYLRTEPDRGDRFFLLQE
jgi:hypothetical protein